MIKRLLPLILVLSLPILFEFKPYEILKLKTFDSLIPKQQPSGYFTVLNITDDDINREGGYPLSRQRLSEINAQVIKKGAIGVGWVVTFPNKGRLSVNGDQAFADSLARIPSVLAMFENDKGIYPNTTGTVILGNDVGGTLATGVTQNIPILAKSTNQGIAVARPEIDSLVRRLPLLLRTPDGWVPAFGTEVLKILAEADTYVIKTNDNGLEEIRVRGLPPVPVDSLGRKWISFVNTPQTNLAEMNVKDRFVFIGYIPDWSLALEILIFSITTIMAWYLINIFGITLGISFTSLLFLLTTVTGYYLIQKGLLIDVTWALISQFIVASTAFYLRFRDLRGFTSLSESVEPEMVTYIMNAVLDVQVQAVNKFEGVTDKFIGDAGMFHWNSIIPQKDHHTLALQAAQEIEKNIDQLNIKFKKEGISEIAIGIGVNSGVCIAGNFGATDRFAFSLIGDPCNVAARLESSTKIAGVGVLIGEETAKNVDFKLQLLKPIEVKGKAKPLQVYTWA